MEKINKYCHITSAPDWLFEVICDYSDTEVVVICHEEYTDQVGGTIGQLQMWTHVGPHKKLLDLLVLHYGGLECVPPYLKFGYISISELIPLTKEEELEVLQEELRKELK